MFWRMHGWLLLLLEVGHIDIILALHIEKFLQLALSCDVPNDLCLKIIKKYIIRIISNYYEL